MRVSDWKGSQEVKVGCFWIFYQTSPTLFKTEKWTYNSIISYGLLIILNNYSIYPFYFI